MAIEEKFKAVSWNKKIIILRTIMDLTQTELADKIGTTRKNVWLWESGKTDPRKISKRAICRALESTEEEIFGESM